MITLDFNGGAQSPADFTPDYSIPTGFQAGAVDNAVGTFIGDGEGINSGWISDTITAGSAAYAEITWPSNGNNTKSRGPIFVNSSGDGYLLLVTGTQARLFLLQSGSLTEIHPVSTSVATGDVFRLSYLGAGEFVFYKNGVQIGAKTDTTVSTGLTPGFISREVSAHIDSFAADTLVVAADYTARKGSTFDVTHGLGTITSATLGGNAVQINSNGAGTVNLTDTSGLTTSGQYDLVLGDGVATETYLVQLNVIGVAPSNNPMQKDGVALGSISTIEVRILNGSALNGTELYYSATVSTDASGNLPSFDLSDQAINDTDPVLMLVKTAAGDSIIADETAGLI